LEVKWGKVRASMLGTVWEKEWVVLMAFELEMDLALHLD